MKLVRSTIANRKWRRQGQHSQEEGERHFLYVFLDQKFRSD